MPPSGPVQSTMSNVGALALLLLAVAATAEAAGALAYETNVDYKTNCIRYDLLSAGDFDVILTVRIGDDGTYTETQQVFGSGFGCISLAAVFTLQFVGSLADPTTPPSRTVYNEWDYSAASNNSAVHSTVVTYSSKNVTLLNSLIVDGFKTACPTFADEDVSLNVPIDLFTDGCLGVGVAPKALCPADYDIMQTLTDGAAIVIGDRVLGADGNKPNRCVLANSPDRISRQVIIAQNPAQYIPPTPQPYTPYPTATVRPTAGAANAAPVLFGAALALAAAASTYF